MPDKGLNDRQDLIGLVSSLMIIEDYKKEKKD